MDLAYDHVQEAVVEAGDGKSTTSTSTVGNSASSLNAEFNEAYKAISNSPWGMKFGGWFGEVKKQGVGYYEAAKGVNVAETATRGLAGLGHRVKRSMSLTGSAPWPVTAAGEAEATDKRTIQEGDEEQQRRGLGQGSGEGFIAMLKANAVKGIGEIEKAEARADEYLLKWGSTIGNFLKEAVMIAPPEGEEFSEGVVGGRRGEEVLFEQGGTGTGEEGKRQIYTTRLDAQLHLLHTSLDLFRADPAVESFRSGWSNSFSAEERTEQIADDLDAYPELRATMEKLVPAEARYEDFWRRYYFLRAELDAEEQKRKELLKGALGEEEEEVGWDSDEGGEGERDKEEREEGQEQEEDEEEVEEIIEKGIHGTVRAKQRMPRSQASTETLQPKARTSADRASQPDSDTSYDIVSGAPSNAASRSGGSPLSHNKKQVDDDSDEDWE